jgi:hypothetical protein
MATATQPRRGRALWLWALCCFIALLFLALVFKKDEPPDWTLPKLDPEKMARTYAADRELANKTHVGTKGLFRLRVSEIDRARIYGPDAIVNLKRPAVGIELGDQVMVKGVVEGFSTDKLTRRVSTVFRDADVVAVGYQDIERYLGRQK